MRSIKAWVCLSPGNRGEKTRSARKTFIRISGGSLPIPVLVSNKGRERRRPSNSYGRSASKAFHSGSPVERLAGRADKLVLYLPRHQPSRCLCSHEFISLLCSSLKVRSLGGIEDLTMGVTLGVCSGPSSGGSLIHIQHILSPSCLINERNSYDSKRQICCTLRETTRGITLYGVLRYRLEYPSWKRSRELALPPRA